MDTDKAVTRNAIRAAKELRLLWWQELSLGIFEHSVKQAKRKAQQ